MTGPPKGAGLAVNQVRLETTLRKLASIGADPAGGVSRLGLSQAESDARGYLAELSRQAGLRALTDPAGNLLVRRRGADRRPALLVGSHLDTVRQGGWLDGAYGVVAAIETLMVLAEAGTECEIEPVAVGFSNEEGALVQYPFWGSRALAGCLTSADLARDREGRPAASYLRAAGGDPDRLTAAAWPAGSLAGYLELHIEQDTVLEHRQVPIGIVNRITGRAIFEMEVRGEPGHAGTMTMRARKDALVAAAELILAVEDIAARRDGCHTATVGFLEVTPNTTNTIPGTARLTAEFRDTDPGQMLQAELLLQSAAARVRDRRQVDVRLRKAHQSDPVSADPALQAAIQRAAGSLRLGTLTLPSRAGHDAQIVATVSPVGMIFVPSKNGISHRPDEDTDIPALAAGANVLLRSVLAFQPRAKYRPAENIAVTTTDSGTPGAET
jgi:beta-ureidopropionase / N-carbamoyl-L-amino-acid hydrolase